MDKYTDGRNGLREQRRYGNAHNAHVEEYDKDVVADDVADAADALVDQRVAGIAGGTEDTGADVVGDERQHAEEVDADIGGSHLVNLFRRLHPLEDKGRDKKTQQRNGGAAHQRNAHGGMNGTLQLPVVVGAEVVGDHHAAAHGHSVEESHQQRHDHTGGAYGRHGIAFDEIAGKENVHRVVELLDQTAAQQRQGKEHQLLYDGTLRQVSSVQLCLFYGRCCIAQRTSLPAEIIQKHDSYEQIFI